MNRVIKKYYNRMFHIPTQFFYIVFKVPKELFNLRWKIQTKEENIFFWGFMWISFNSLRSTIDKKTIYDVTVNAFVCLELQAWWLDNPLDKPLDND